MRLFCLPNIGTGLVLSSLKEFLPPEKRSRRAARLASVVEPGYGWRVADFSVPRPGPLPRKMG